MSRFLAGLWERLGRPFVRPPVHPALAAHRAAQAGREAGARLGEIAGLRGGGEKKCEEKSEAEAANGVHRSLREAVIATKFLWSSFPRKREGRYQRIRWVSAAG